MKRILTITALVALFAISSFAAMSKTYQVTGPVLELRPDVIVVQKGSEKWEITRDASTKVKGDLKVGSKVTIEYRMTATTVSVSEEKAAPAKKK